MLIVDTNTWGCVFDANNTCHRTFSPVRDYILKTPQSLAWGGTKYWKELQKAEKYLRIHLELQKAKIAVRFDDLKIDQQERRVAGLVNHPDFDDPHIVAIQIVSKAPLIVTADKRSHRFIKLKRLYPKKHPKPRIYSLAQHKDLLTAL